MRKVSVLTLSLVMLVNGSVVYSAPKRKRNAGIINISVPSVNTTVSENSAEQKIEALENIENTQTKKEISDLLLILNTNIEKAKDSCLGIKDDLKTIQVLAGVATGASSLGTLASGGALATGIVKSVKDKKIEESKQQNNDIEKLLNMSDAEFEQAVLSGEVSRILRELSDNITKDDVKETQTALQKEIDKDTKTSQTLGNVRTGLMAGSIATSAASTITSGISIKKLDDLIGKMKDCNRAAQQIKSDISVIQSEIDDIEYLKDDYRFYKAGNIVNSCSGFDTNNIKEIKSVMTASTVVGGVGTVVSTAGTITSALANSKKIRNDDSEDGVKKEKGLNLASNIMAGVSTGTSAGGIVLGAVTLSKLSKNVDVAESCEDALK